MAAHFWSGPDPYLDIDLDALAYSSEPYLNQYYRAPKVGRKMKAYKVPKTKAQKEA
jgi:hypothetical protein